jgi:hypothetical protein
MNGLRWSRRNFVFRALCLVLVLNLALLGACSKKDDEETPPALLTLTNASASPTTQYQGLDVLFTVDASSPDGTVTSVTVDLTDVGGTVSDQQMYDDGTNGDATASDGTYSFNYTLSGTAPTGPAMVDIVAADSLGQSAADMASVTIAANTAPVLTGAFISRDPTPRGVFVLVTVDVADAESNISTVEADLPSIGGVSNATMYDDGNGGDVTASDGTYSRSVLVSPSATPGMNITITFTGTDTGGLNGTDVVTFEILNNIAPQVSNPTATPSTQVQLLDVVFSVMATDDGTIASVVIDLTAIGGTSGVAMLDDGQTATSGDAFAGDDIFSTKYTLGGRRARTSCPWSSPTTTPRRSTSTSPSPWRPMPRP